MRVNGLLVNKNGESNGRPKAAFWIPRFLFYGVLFLVGLAGCETNTNVEIHKFDGRTMGTTYHVSVVGLPMGFESPQLATLIDDSLQSINQLMSTYIADSEVSRFGRMAPDRWFDVSADTYNVLKASQELSRISAGAFDVTVGPVVALWGFGPQYTLDKVPSQKEIDRAKESTGFEYLWVNSEALSIKKTRSLEIDLSAIAKGYAVDDLVAELKRLGVLSALVEVGGEIRGYGKKPNGDEWKIAIERPVEGVRSIHKTISLVDRAVATSGDYRNYFEADGVRYSHTIDPNSGYPIRHRLASVSVIHESAMYADGWATSLMVLGAEKGFRLAEKNDIAAYFIVREDGSFTERQTELFKSYVN
ncbi:MAG: hypothetical protein COB51_10930 [Moraxellaceae bacterium]|nr:MAG: hypothetical protein COB51_10930 [Moraxellaceae bacterium]